MFTNKSEFLFPYMFMRKINTHEELSSSVLISVLMEAFSRYAVGDLAAFVIGRSLAKATVRQIERF